MTVPSSPSSLPLIGGEAAARLEAERLEVERVATRDALYGDAVRATAGASTEPTSSDGDRPSGAPDLACGECGAPPDEPCPFDDGEQPASCRETVIEPGPGPGPGPDLLAQVRAAGGVVVEPPKSPPAPRQRRSYLVFESHTFTVPAGHPTLAEGDVEAWVLLAEGVAATGREAPRQAADTAREGRNGTYATVLDGEFRTHTIDDPQAELVEQIVTDLLDRPALASVDRAELRATIATSLKRAEGGTS